jgi:hypothetical protein
MDASGMPGTNREGGTSAYYIARLSNQDFAVFRETLVWIYRIEGSTFSCLHQFDAEDYMPDEISTVGYADSDGKLLAISGMSKQGIVIVDLEAKEEMFKIDFPETCVGFLLVGRFFIAANMGGNIGMFDANFNFARIVPTDNFSELIVLLTKLPVKDLWIACA